jgi:acetate---CoA ligase (ADP-forming)
VAFLAGLAPESRRMRFGGMVSDLEGLARRWSAPGDPADCSLVAEAGIPDRVIGQATYDRVAPDSAEVAFIVAEDFQGRGIATLLLEALAERARDAGIVSFCAEVMPENARMFEVFRESGFPTRVRAEPGSVLIEFPTALEGPARERFERREQIAAAAAVRALLYPAAIAVIGASRHRGTIGGEVFHNLIGSGFAGPVYPVDPTADVVQSVEAYRSIAAIPGPVDLAVIAVPSDAAVDAARECAGKGVKTLVVLSPGFAETGGAGRERQAALLAASRQAGMRLVGPNCMGLMNLDPDIRMNATFSPTAPQPGRVGFLSQSGSLVVAAIEHANRLGLGLASAISIGNKADLSGNDFLQYWEGDPGCAVIALYLESLGNPRKFARIARRVGRSKPIIAVKSGRSAAGARATSSHTGALIGASDVTVDALFRQAGVVRTDTLGEFFDVATLLANQPLPAGPRVAIVTNGGGPGILAADACEANGLVVPPLPGRVRAALAEFLPPEAALGNPVDTIEGSPESFGRTIGILADWDGIDSIIVLFAPPLAPRTEAVAAAIRDAVRELPRQIPVLTVFMSGRPAPSALRNATSAIPAYHYPEEAARALGHAVRYARWRATPLGGIPHFADVRDDRAAAALAGALAAIVPGVAATETEGAAPGGFSTAALSAAAPGEPSTAASSDGRSRWLRHDEVARVLECYGIGMAPWRLADTPAEAGRAAEEIGGQVALKAVARGIVRKAEAGAVRLRLQGDEVERAASEMAARLATAGHPVERFLVQSMIVGGAEMLVGVVHDRLFGPVIACGPSGAELELTRDVAVRITPLTDRDAAEMVRSLATFPLLTGLVGREEPQVDVAALEETLLRISAMVEAHPEIAELDCGPLVVLERGALVVDARIRIELPGAP